MKEETAILFPVTLLSSITVKYRDELDCRVPPHLDKKSTQ